MATYLVERTLTGIPMDALAAAQRRAIDTAARMSRDGKRISYVRSAFVPADGRCMCLFEANSEADVKRLNDEAGLPYHRIVAAMDLTP